MSGSKFPGTRSSADIKSLMRRIEEKLNSPVFNGGFDALFQKVEFIEENVTKLNTAVFDPEKGLFVRVQSEVVETDHDVKTLDAKIAEQSKKIAELDDSLKTYRKFIIGAAFSVISAIAKLVWDLSKHITFN